MLTQLLRHWKQETGRQKQPTSQQEWSQVWTLTADPSAVARQQRVAIMTVEEERGEETSPGEMMTTSGDDRAEAEPAGCSSHLLSNHPHLVETSVLIIHALLHLQIHDALSVITS